MINHNLYLEDIYNISNLNINWNQLKNKILVLSGASGLLGHFLIDVIMHKNIHSSLNCKIIAIGRNKEKAKSIFSIYWDSQLFSFLQHNINIPLENENIKNIDYVLHLASNTHPIAYSSDPIGTISTNIIGTNNFLAFAVKHNAKRFLFSSSVEIYGENKGDVEFFDEHYLGYLDSNTLRAGYPESKRCGEALCQAYRKQYGIETVIPRLARSYGPTMQNEDSKAIAQFIKKAIQGENIVLKSAGNQYYSYTYSADAVSGLLKILTDGKDGEAYNIADPISDITLKELAGTIARIAGTKVVFESPDEKERAGYSTATKARLNGNKLKSIGWVPIYGITQGLERTIKIKKELQNN